jgi:hypothetical protein
MFPQNPVEAVKRPTHDGSGARWNSIGVELSSGKGTERLIGRRIGMRRWGSRTERSQRCVQRRKKRRIRVAAGQVDQRGRHVGCGH